MQVTAEFLTHQNENASSLRDRADKVNHAGTLTDDILPRHLSDCVRPSFQKTGNLSRLRDWDQIKVKTFVQQTKRISLVTFTD